jgi:pSer/pThr/pTyr-binding forkhead associated (FHA) protein
MAKLVLLNAGLTGRSHELKVDKTTVGRVEDNSFQIADSSISGHHCEILSRGSDVVVKDLNSTNGTFINGERVTTERVLKPGQILRLGQVELRLETGAMSAAETTATQAAPPAPVKKPLDQTMVMQRGVSLTELEQGSRATGFDTSKAFSKKTNKSNRLFWIAVAVVGVILVVVFLVVFSMIKK